jgi:hypothetical protein
MQGAVPNASRGATAVGTLQPFSLSGSVMKQPPIPKRLASVRHAAEMFDTSVSTLNRAVRAGKLKKHHYGRRGFLDPDEIEGMIKGGRVHDSPHGRYPSVSPIGFNRRGPPGDRTSSPSSCSITVASLSRMK